MPGLRFPLDLNGSRLDRSIKADGSDASPGQVMKGDAFGVVKFRILRWRGINSKWPEVKPDIVVSLGESCM